MFVGHNNKIRGMGGHLKDSKTKNVSSNHVSFTSFALINYRTTPKLIKLYQML